MILLEVRNHIKQRKQVNLQALAAHFQCDSQIMRDMVGHWLRKGVICKAPKPTGCGVRCVACEPSVVEVYCWV